MSKQAEMFQRMANQSDKNYALHYIGHEALVSIANLHLALGHNLMHAQEIARRALERMTEARR